MSVLNWLGIKLSVIAEFSILPIGTKSTSLSPYVAEAIKALTRVEGVKFQVGPMSTILEAKTLDEIFRAVRVAHETVFKAGALRVVTSLVIDDRRDGKRGTMINKVKAIEGYLKGKQAASYG